jgi:hypothetical protein
MFKKVLPSSDRARCKALANGCLESSGLKQHLEIPKYREWGKKEWQQSFLSSLPLHW